MKTAKISARKKQKLISAVAAKHHLTEHEASYFVFTSEITNRAYNPKTQPINILMKSNKVKPLNKVSNHLNIGSISHTITKYYICYPKALD